MANPLALTKSFTKPAPDRGHNLIIYSFFIFFNEIKNVLFLFYKFKVFGCGTRVTFLIYALSE